MASRFITSKFRFHLIAIYALGCFRKFSCTPVPKLPWRAPNPRETSDRMNFNVIDKKQLTWKLFIYWYLMSCFHLRLSLYTTTAKTAFQRSLSGLILKCITFTCRSCKLWWTNVTCITRHYPTCSIFGHGLGSQGSRMASELKCIP